MDSEASATSDHRDAPRLFELPRDYFDETVRLILQSAVTGGPTPDRPTLELIERLRPATVTYRQALHSARSGKNGGVSLETETQAVRSNCPYGLSFAIDFACERQAGIDDRAAVMLALRANLNAGPHSTVSGVLAARLNQNEETMTSTAAGGAVSGVTASPLSRAAVNQATRTFVTLTGQAPSAEMMLLVGTNPLTSLVAVGVVNLNFYRAALGHSISWTQFTKNMLIKTSAMLGGISGWASGAAFGAGAAGPFGALIGGLVGGLSGGSLGSAGAKRFADHFVADDAQRMLAIVRERSEVLAMDYLLTLSEIDSFAGQIKTRVTPSWLRQMYQAGRHTIQPNNTRQDRLSAAFAHKELESFCTDLVRQRQYVDLPTTETVVAVLTELS